MSFSASLSFFSVFASDFLSLIILVTGFQFSDIVSQFLIFLEDIADRSLNVDAYFK